MGILRQHRCHEEREGGDGEARGKTYSRYDTPARAISRLAIQTASSALQRLFSSLALSSNSGCPLACASTANKLKRIATKARNRAASARRNTHVPAYWPGVVGVQDAEKRDVLVEVKKVIDMVDMCIPDIPDIVVLESVDVVGVDMCMLVAARMVPPQTSLFC